jgi:YHS domain-containing protein
MLQKDITVLLLLIVFSLAQDKIEYSEIVVDSSGVALRGWDVVSYFTDSAGVVGSSQHITDYDGVEWHFANKTNRDLFIKSPEKYIPQYGGYCAFGVKFGRKVVTDPQVYSIVDEKLYFNLNESIKEQWEKRISHNTKKADRKWSKVSLRKIN